MNDGKAVFGELNIMLRDSCFRMQYSPSIQKTILKKYLDKAFVEELHSTHPYDFFNSYGAYVATDYSSGGRGQAIYAGLYNKELISQDREGDMSKEINSSYVWEDNKLGGNLKIGRGRESTISTTQSFSSVKVSVKTLGGSASGGFSIPQEVGNSSVDLSGWLSSLSDKSSHVISDFNQNGLIPISDFILEDNLKQLFNKFIDGEVAINPTITEPYINIT